MGHRQHTLHRRTIIAGVGAAALGSGLGVAPAAGQQQDAFVVEQGEECIPVTPLSGEEPVETFYDWDLAHTDYSSLGTKDLQREDTSLLFLYRGPEDDLSLVVVHDEHVAFDRQPTTDGGSATFVLEGLPEDGEWLVEDDDYDGNSNFDNWNTDSEPQQIDWTWGEARTDGGVFGHLGSSFEFTIDPAFNDRATLAGQHYEGQITDWELLSGDVENPERTALDLDQPVTIRAGTCQSVDEEPEDVDDGDDDDDDEGADNGGEDDNGDDGDDFDDDDDGDDEDDFDDDDDDGDENDGGPPGEGPPGEGPPDDVPPGQDGNDGDEEGSIFDDIEDFFEDDEEDEEEDDDDDDDDDD